jgi:hypothetical protein
MTIELLHPTGRPDHESSLPPDGGSAMWPLTVVVVDVEAEDMFEMAAVEDQ